MNGTGTRERPRRRPGGRPRRHRATRRVGTAAAIACCGALLLGGTGCFGPPAEDSGPRTAYFIGIDVSGSFERSGRYEDALDFTARYIHAHLNGFGDLDEPRALFVGSVGGDAPDQTQGFHPIHDFEGKSVDEIRADLREWFPPNDLLTDFNTFFERVSTLAKRHNLVLAPINIVVMSDGIPDVGAVGGSGDRPDDPYTTIDFDPLEYLARNVTVRMLYPDPDVATNWENRIERSRVRLWTVDSVVMQGWRDQLTLAAATADTAGSESGEESSADAVEEASTAPEAQPALWRWIKDNVDFRVRRGVL